MLGATLGLVGCGGDNAPSPEEAHTGFQRALDHVGEGVSPSGTGYGWVELDSSHKAEVAGALGPGAEDFVKQPDRLRSVGIDPSSAETATSVATSYGLAVRFDGLEPGRLPALLRMAGATPRREGEWTEYDLGEEWEALFGARWRRLRTSPRESRSARGA